MGPINIIQYYLHKQQSRNMGYANFRNEENTENAETNSARYNISSDELFKKKESYWFLALILSLILIGSVIFYCAHTGG